MGKTPTLRTQAYIRITNEINWIFDKVLIWLLIDWNNWHTQNANPWGKKLHLGNLLKPKWPIFITYDNWHSAQAKAWQISNNSMVCINQLHDWTLFVWYTFHISDF